MKILYALMSALMLASPVAGAQQPAETATEWQFDVFLGDKEIGYHRFSASALEDAWLVQNEASFEVRFLFIKAFEYEHSNSEVWRGGCLRSIDARTNSNGQQLQVLGRQQAEAFVLEEQGGDRTVDDCVATFAYWDRNLLQRGRLLNAQTGEYLAVDYKNLPGDSLRIGERLFEVERLHLSARGLDIVVSYDRDSGQWLALESTLKNGRTLVYRRSAGYLPPTGGERVATATDGSLIAEVRER